MKTPAFCGAAIAALILTGLPALAQEELPTIIVASSAELEAALTSANAGRRILVLAGDYTVSRPLTVPDGATVSGEGIMLFDAAGLPTGFVEGTRSRLQSGPTLVGDILTLGNGSTVRAIGVKDVKRPNPTRGNLIVVSSRWSGDTISANIVECELENLNPGGVVPPTTTNIPAGQNGRSVMVVTRNLNMGFDPPPHADATLTVSITRSIARAPEDGSGVLAINFAPRGNITVKLAGNVMGGGLDADGGVCRPDAVFDSTVTFESRDNLYRSDRIDALGNPAPGPSGWQFHGGASAPFVIGSGGTPGSQRNSLFMNSVDDRIQGYTVGVVAIGGERFVPPFAVGPSSFNRLDLQLHGTRLSSVAADFRLVGAIAGGADFAAGDGNLLRVLLRGVIGSGSTGNFYRKEIAAPGYEGTDNRFEIVGNRTAFDATNQNIDSEPMADFFSNN